MEHIRCSQLFTIRSGWKRDIHVPRIEPKRSFGMITTPRNGVRRWTMRRLHGAVDRDHGDRRIALHSHYVSDRPLRQRGAERSARVFVRRPSPDRRPCGEQCIEHIELEGSRGARAATRPTIRPCGVPTATISYQSDRIGSRQPGGRPGGVLQRRHVVAGVRPFSSPLAGCPPPC